MGDRLRPERNEDGLGPGMPRECTPRRFCMQIICVTSARDAFCLSTLDQAEAAHAASHLRILAPPIIAPPPTPPNSSPPPRTATANSHSTMCSTMISDVFAWVLKLFKTVFTAEASTEKTTVASEKVSAALQQQVDVLKTENALLETEHRELLHLFVTLAALSSSRDNKHAEAIREKEAQLDASLVAACAFQSIHEDRERHFAAVEALLSSRCQKHAQVIREKEAQLNSTMEACHKLLRICKAHKRQYQDREQDIARYYLDRQELADDVIELKAELESSQAQSKQLAATITSMESLLTERGEMKHQRSKHEECQLGQRKPALSCKSQLARAQLSTTLSLTKMIF